MEIGKRTNLSRGGTPWTPRFLVVLDVDRCTRCGFCLKICPAGVFSQHPDGKVTLAHVDQCWGCTVCERMCKERALVCRPAEE